MQPIEKFSFQYNVEEYKLLEYVYPVAKNMHQTLIITRIQVNLSWQFRKFQIFLKEGITHVSCDINSQ